METKGIYIYGIVPNFYSGDLFRALKESGVYFISSGNISAIVSDRESTFFDFSDRESLAYQLVHHQQTIEKIMGIGFNIILPMKLGTIVGSKDEVLTILTKGQDLIKTTLEKIEFLTEIDLAVTWGDFGKTLNEIASHPEIVEMRDSLLKNIDLVSQIDQVKVGMLIQEKLEAKNKQVELKILETLSKLSVDIKMHEVMDGQMVTNSAFIINRNKKELFENGIYQLDEEFDGLLNFKMVGPLPCYSFYTLEVKKLDPDHIAQAKMELGLRDEATETEIKKAYIGKAKLFHPDVISPNGNQDRFTRISKAYHELLDYSAAMQQSSKDEFMSRNSGNSTEDLILVKIKD